MTSMNHPGAPRRTKRLTTIAEYHDGTTQVIIDLTTPRELLATFLRRHYDGDVTITACADDHLPHDPATLDLLGISAEEYVGTAHVIADLVGLEAADAAEILDVVAAVLAVAR